MRVIEAMRRMAKEKEQTREMGSGADVAQHAFATVGHFLNSEADRVAFRPGDGIGALEHQTRHERRFNERGRLLAELRRQAWKQDAGSERNAGDGPEN